MKDKLFRLIESFTRRLRERITSSQDSPVTSCCLLFVSIYLSRVCRLKVAKSRHRYTTTGLGKLLTLYGLQINQFVGTWKDENRKSSINSYQYCTILTQAWEQKQMTSTVLNGNWFDDIVNDIKNLNLNLCTETKNFQQTECKLKKVNLFRVLGEEILKDANLVDNKWDSFSEEKKQKLKFLAHKIIEPRKFSLFTRIKILFRNIILSLVGTKKDVDFCSDALVQLADNIFNAIEHDDPNYEIAILGMLETVKQHPEMGEIVTSGNIRDKLKRLSDKAYTEF